LIEEVGTVQDVQKNAQGEAQFIWVETQVKSTCGSCEARKNCGTGAIAKVFAKKQQKLKYQYSGAVSVGQKVTLGIAEESLLKASALMYLLPLFILVISALLTQTLLPILGLASELWIIAVAFFATGLSFVGVRYYLNQSHKGHFKPQLLGVVVADSKTISVKQL
jgi:sigma-E factor negative regulatory protein RseC